MKTLIERVPHIPIDDIEIRSLQTYLQSNCPPSLKSYKKNFYKLWYRKIRSRLKQKSKNRRKTSNIYAITHKQNQDNDKYWSDNIFFTFDDLKYNKRLLSKTNNNNDNNTMKNPVQSIVKMFKHNEIVRISDDIYHTFHSNDKVKVSIILSNFQYECPICFGYKNITSSFIHDCGHLMCNDCVSSTISCFPETNLKNLFNKCHICRSNNE